jgi:hypothetical protein
MKILIKSMLIVISSVLAFNAAFAQERDVEESKDYPLLPRIQNFYISGYMFSEYESHEFYDSQDNEYIVQGKKWVIDYTLREGFPDPGQLKVRNNYIDVVKKLGGSILFDQGLYMKAVRGGKEVWIEVWVSDYGNDYTITAVERPMFTQKAAADAQPAAVSMLKKKVSQNPEIVKIEHALAHIKKNRDRSVTNLEIVIKLVQKEYAAAFPGDPCRTPSAPGPIPIPYPNIGKSSDTSKGSKKVEINADRSAAMENDSDFKASESDEIGAKTAELTEHIQSHFKQVASSEREIWKNKLMMYQDQAAAITKALEKYEEEVEKLLEESKQELGLGIK